MYTNVKMDMLNIEHVKMNMYENTDFTLGMLAFKNSLTFELHQSDRLNNVAKQNCSCFQHLVITSHSINKKNSQKLFTQTQEYL